jgi:two-component system LytT family response regulator
MKISCIIIDDEPHALSLLEGYIIKMPFVDLKGKFFDAIDALEFLKKENADLIFTDINMPTLSGLELADVLPGNQKFIFTTAFAEHALTSFSYNVIDYLLKPIIFKRFIQAVNKAEAMMISGMNSTEHPNNIVFVKSGKKIVKIDFSEVFYLKGEKEYISLQFKNEKLLVYKRMKEMELILPGYFKRIHNSYIINTNLMKKIEMNHVLIGDLTIPIGENYRDNFLKFLGERTI